MKIGIKDLAAGAALLALATGVVATGAGTALAATTGNGGVTVAWQPDANSLGNLFFYDAAGHQVTSGSTTSGTLAAYYVAPVTGQPSATVYTTTPETGNSATWSGTQQLTSTQTLPKAGLPGDLAGFAGAVVADDSGLSFNAQQVSAFPNNLTATGYQNLYEVRMYTGTNNTQWYAADIYVDPATGAWNQVYPVQTQPTVSMTSPTATSGTSGSAITLSASVSPASAGTVQFYDGSAPVGSAQPVSASTSTASVSTTPAQGSHSYTATFVPTPGTTGLQATSAAKPYTAAAPAAATTISFVSQNVGTYANDPATFVFAVSPAAAPGTVVFKDGATTLGNGTAVSGTPGQYSLTTSALGQGTHTVSAQFLSGDSATYSDSNVASGPSFSYVGSPTVGAPSQANVTTNVTAGIVTITTPYTSGSPFDLGALVLDSTGSFLVGSATFPAAADSPITITDTRAGDLPWTATVTSSDLVGRTDPTNKINGQNFGFAPSAATYPAGNSLTGKVVVSSTAPANGVAAGDPGSAGLKGGPTFAQVLSPNSGVGTAYIRGLLSLKAPTSAKADRYDGVLTFTVIGS